MSQSSTMKLSRGRLAAVIAAACLVATAAAAQVKDWPSESPPRPLAAKSVKFPPYEVRTLPNGLQVVVVMQHEQPVVSVRMLVRAGSAYDPPGKQGLASLAAALLDQGTESKSANDIADTIDYIGGGLGAGAGSDLTFANVVVMKDSLALGMELLSDVVRHPAFKPEEIDRQRQQAISGLRVSYEDPDYVASMVFDRLVYGFHPYGLPNNGTPETLAAITDADLHAFHDRFFVPNNSILAIVGDVGLEEAFSGAERVFGPWPRQDVGTVPTSEPPPPTRRMIVVNKPDAVQTEIRVGQALLPRKHPDYLAMELAIKVLGGEGSNRLQRVLRSERSLTYGAEADLDALKQAGDFEANTDTRTETTVEALRVVFDEINKLQRERVNERELGDAQAYVEGNFPLTIETPDQIATQVLNVLFYELPLSDLDTYRERVNAITTDDVQRVAREYLHPDRLSVVLVGNAAAFVNELKGLGFDQFEVVDLPDLDLTTPDFRRASHTPQGGAGMVGAGQRSASPQR